MINRDICCPAMLHTHTTSLLPTLCVTCYGILFLPHFQNVGAGERGLAVNHHATLHHRNTSCFYWNFKKILRCIYSILMSTQPCTTSANFTTYPTSDTSERGTRCCMMRSIIFSKTRSLGTRDLISNVSLTKLRISPWIMSLRPDPT